jgi:DNA-directed RNA polymerase specialized sigma24 family protein
LYRTITGGFIPSSEYLSVWPQPLAFGSEAVHDVDMVESLRPRLFSIAYRMLGSANDAEDVLQDAWIRLSGVETHDVRLPQAPTTTIATRLCLDRLKSAPANREEAVYGALIYFPPTGFAARAHCVVADGRIAGELDRRTAQIPEVVRKLYLLDYCGRPPFGA